MTATTATATTATATTATTATATTTPKRRFVRAVDQSGMRTRLNNKAGKVASLPITLESGRIACIGALKGYSLKNTFKGTTEMTAFGHKYDSKAGACDCLLLEALSGDFDVKSLIKNMINHKSNYGRSDTAQAMSKRVHDHLGMSTRGKNAGYTYFEGATHATRYHTLTLAQRQALGKFGADLSITVRDIFKSVFADLKPTKK